MVVSIPMIEFSEILIDSFSVMSPHATLLSYSSPENIKDLRDQAALISMLWREQESEIKASQATSSWPQPQSEFTTVDESVVPDGALETLTIEFDHVNIIARAVQPRLLLVLVGGAAPNTNSTQFKITSEKRGESRYPATPSLSRRAIFNLSGDDDDDDSRHDSPHSDFLESPVDAPKKPKNSGGPRKEAAAVPHGAITPKHNPSPPRSQPTTPRSEVVTSNRDGNTTASDNVLAERVLKAQENQELSPLDEDVKLGLLHIQRKKVDLATEHMRRDFKAKGFTMPHQDIIP
jgi:hypothetical protein